MKPSEAIYSLTVLRDRFGRILDSTAARVRVWALDKNLCYRADWDAERVREELNESLGRVMLRFHFDLAEPPQSGPKYHIQIGGVPHGGELWWLPPSLNLPRIAHPPIDLVLACEMIAANFFPL